jgi:hypothetical protein
VAEFSVIVEDVNDNAPYLNMPNGLVWPENTPPGTPVILYGLRIRTSVSQQFSSAFAQTVPTVGSFGTLASSVADLDTGSVAFLTLGSGIRVG